VSVPDCVVTELDTDGIARVTLNRPDVSNALSLELLRSLAEAVVGLHAEPGLRAAVLTGAGSNFCGGGDVREFASRGTGLPAHLRAVTAWLQVAASGLIRLPVPVVTLVQGWATGGGGMGLVCASDIVIAGESARFMLGATRVGMAPDAGLSVTLTRLVGMRRAMEISLTNPVIDAETALRDGLVTRVVPDDRLVEVGEALTRDLASGPTRALGETKRLLWTGLGSSVEAALPDEGRTVAELSGTADSLEGLAAVIERRRPAYVGR
jgi:2-(1,2-epoxy-1,2-dihydrophenyl)acetyl-CoA isomerase